MIVLTFLLNLGFKHERGNKVSGHNFAKTRATDVIKRLVQLTECEVEFPEALNSQITSPRPCSVKCKELRLLMPN